MYTVVVKTSNSPQEFGTQIKSTGQLHDFLCAMDFQLVTKLEVHYYRELKTPHDFTNTDTAPNQMVTDLISNGPDSWTVQTPKVGETGRVTRLTPVPNK